MNPIIYLFNETIYRPLLNALVFIYAAIPYHDLGLAILILTALVRLLLHPALAQSIRSQRAMARLQPKLREIQENHKGNREEQSRQTLELYRTEGVHPLSGCLPILVQLPILIGLYRVFWKGIALQDPALLYGFLPAIHAFNPIAFGVFDLTERSIPLAILAGISQFFQTKFFPQPAEAAGAGAAADFGRAMRLQTTYFLPFIIIVISWSLPSAIAFYWTVLNLLAIVQQLWIQRSLQP